MDTKFLAQSASPVDPLNPAPRPYQGPTLNELLEFQIGELPAVAGVVDVGDALTFFAGRVALELETRLLAAHQLGAQVRREAPEVANAAELGALAGLMRAFLADPDPEAQKAELALWAATEVSAEEERARAVAAAVEEAEKAELALSAFSAVFAEEERARAVAAQVESSAGGGQ